MTRFLLPVGCRSTRLLRAWLLAALCAPLVAFAQPVERAAPLPVPVPRTTGDATLDARLLDIDRYGARYRAAFVDELVRYHAAPRELVHALLERGWSPGDVYYACALAHTTGRACRHVADDTGGDAAPDWIAIARRLDVAPDSPRLAHLHERIEATYRRWGRPLPPAAVVAATPVDPRVPIAPPPRAPDTRTPRRATAVED
jgi:hypothetical protein